MSERKLTKLEEFLFNTVCRSEEEFNELMKIPSDDHETSIEDIEIVRFPINEELYEWEDKVRKELEKLEDE